MVGFLCIRVPLPKINLSFLWSLTSLVQSEITQSKVKARAGGGVGSGYQGVGRFS